MESEEVAVSKIVDTCLAYICFSFLAACNVSNVLEKSDSSWKIKMMGCKSASLGGHILVCLGMKALS